MTFEMATALHLERLRSSSVLLETSGCQEWYTRMCGEVLPNNKFKGDFESFCHRHVEPCHLGNSPKVRSG